MKFFMLLFWVAEVHSNEPISQSRNFQIICLKVGLTGILFYFALFSLPAVQTTLAKAFGGNLKFDSYANKSHIIVEHLTGVTMLTHPCKAPKMTYRAYNSASSKESLSKAARKNNSKCRNFG